MSSMEVTCTLMMEANQDHIFNANEHSKKRCIDDSVKDLQVEHIKGKEHPLEFKFSSVGTFLCINLQIKRDFEGGMAGPQIAFVQVRFWTGPFLNKKASFKDNTPDCSVSKVTHLLYDQKQE